MTTECSGVLEVTTGCSGVLEVTTGCSGVLEVTTGCSGVLEVTTECRDSFLTNTDRKHVCEMKYWTISLEVHLQYQLHLTIQDSKSGQR